MNLLLGPIELSHYSDANLADLLAKVEMIGGKGAAMHQSLEAEIIRRQQVNVTPGMVSTADPWLVELAPGKWVTATTADLLAVEGMAVETGQISPERAQRSLKRLLEAGKIRPNPARTRVEEVAE